MVAVPSPAPVTVTGWGVCQFAVVNVNAPDTVALADALDAGVTTTSAVGAAFSEIS